MPRTKENVKQEIKDCHVEIDDMEQQILSLEAELEEWDEEHSTNENKEE